MYIKLCRSPDKRILIAIANLKIAVCMSNSGRRDHESLGQAYSRIKRFLLFMMTGKLLGGGGLGGGDNLNLFRPSVKLTFLWGSYIVAMSIL